MIGSPKQKDKRIARTEAVPNDVKTNAFEKLWDRSSPYIGLDVDFSPIHTCDEYTVLQ